MGYWLQAFVGRSKDITRFEKTFDLATIINLNQDISLIMLTEELFKQITDSAPGQPIEGFEYLTINVERKVLEYLQNSEFAYVEADYWGGEGSQSAIVWRKGERIMEIKQKQNAINSILHHFGVVAKKKKDEFDTLQFGKLRSDRGWDIV